MSEVKTRAARVLVVDDSHDNADLLALVLRKTGAETHCAYAGAQGIAEFRRLEPEVVLVDIGLPDLSGYDVARAIRAEPRGADVLLIAVTGHGDERSGERAKEAGFDDRLRKPVEIAVLEERIRRHLEARS